MPPFRPVKDRFAEHVSVGPVPELRPDLGPCLLWTGRIDAAGYGRLDYLRRPQLAHRLSYEWAKGPIPVGQEPDHLCRVRRCVNADHLEAVTRLENVRRGQGHGSEIQCPNGHSYDEQNTYRTLSGARACRACHRIEERQRQHVEYTRRRAMGCNWNCASGKHRCCHCECHAKT
jgi:HNH endonuclease